MWQYDMMSAHDIWGFLSPLFSAAKMRSQFCSNRKKQKQKQNQNTTVLVLVYHDSNIIPLVFTVFWKLIFYVPSCQCT